MSNRLYKIICIATILLIVSIRFHLANMPYERDEGEFAYAGQLITQGVPPYQEIYNMKFPGTYFMYAASYELLGENIAAPRYVTLVLQLIAAGFIFLLARRIINPAAGWMAATVFMLFNLAPALFGELAKAEHFLVAFLVPSIYFLYRGSEKKSMAYLVISGAAASLACLMKQHAFLFILAGGIWLIYEHRRSAIKYLFAYGIGVAIPAFITIFYLWHAGVWDRFYYLTIIYAKAYVGLAHWAQGAINVYRFMSVYFELTPVLCLCSFIAVAGLFVRGGNLKTRLFLGLLLVMSVWAVAQGLYFRRHYFLILTPVLTLLFTYTSFLIYERYSNRWGYATLSAILVVNVFFFMFLQRGIFFTQPLSVVSHNVYPYNPFDISAEIAGYIKQHTKPGDRVAEIGQEPQFFFLSQRRSASGYIYLYPFFEKQKYAGQMVDEYIAQIEQSNPPILVYSSYATFGGGMYEDSKLYKWFINYKRNYKLVAMQIPPEVDPTRPLVFDTIAPVDTFSTAIPQVAIYMRVK